MIILNNIISQRHALINEQKKTGNSNDLAYDTFKRALNASKLKHAKRTIRLRHITRCLRDTDSLDIKNNIEKVRVVVAITLKQRCLFKMLLDRVTIKPPNISKNKKSPEKNKSA